MTENSSLVISSRISELETVRKFTDNLCLNYNIDAGIAYKFNLAFEELLSNIVFYGYDDESIHEIEILFSYDIVKLSATIKDDGKAFNPLEKAEPDTSLSIDERKIGGLGIHLVRKMMDEVRYKREGEFNIFYFSKNIK
ncbi:MAG: ATP-binding protein [Ignavibacteria bacterium]|jgi:serine/threonine-protein kinase RsbW/sigma-B regulation protein RsbU (phosphoserine phosphatase)|nr:ATP-binding protein [Ignavibacteria bacterium]MDP3830337.1 ATP-binding protein [Ignavibacteriaceae bacterium]